MIKFYPLTYVQKVIWDIENLIPNTSINNIAGILRFNEVLDVELLKKAVNLLIKKTMHYEFV